MALLCFRNYYWPHRIRMKNHLQLEKKIRENVSTFLRKVKTFNYFVHVLTSQTVDSKCLIFWQTETPTSWGYNTWKIVQFKIPSIKSTFLKLFERNKGTCVAILFSKIIQFSLNTDYVLHYFSILCLLDPITGHNNFFLHSPFQTLT